MKYVYILIKDDYDEYDGSITDVIGIFKRGTKARHHRKNIVRQEQLIHGDKVNFIEKDGKTVRINLHSGSITYIIEKKELQ